MGIRNRPKNKNPPVLSHEFLIQNHADIVSCVAMVFVVGLMFHATSPIASLFVAMQHNVTTDIEGDESTGNDIVYYTYGAKDMCAIFFYFLICIVMHAVVQEYILDKLNRKMHLSKVKHSKFNESGQLLAFHLVSVIWGADIIYRGNYTLNISLLWDAYPHNEMTFVTKFFFIMQMAYWLHSFPELYFQKVKKDEMGARIQYAILYLVFIGAAYLLNFNRIALCLIVLHYTAECIFHFARLTYFSEKLELANTTFMLWNVMFVLVRLGSVTLTVLTFWYGLQKSTTDVIEFAAGNFNTQLVRINCLAAVGLLQSWLMWNFITFHLKRVREQAAMASTKTETTTKGKRAGAGEKKKKKKDEGRYDDDVGELPEVDQNQLRTRKSKELKANCL